MKTFEKYITDLPKGVKFIVLSNIIVYLIFILIKLSLNVSLIDYFSAYPTYSENFNPITILTSIFVHSYFPSHLVMNMIFMLVFAPSVEKSLGLKRFIKLFFFSGIVGFLTVNYSYYQNKKTIEESLKESSIDINNIEIENGKVSNEYLSHLDENKSKIVVNYNFVISKTYGASSSLFGIIIFYVLLNLKKIKKILIVLLGLILITNTCIILSEETWLLNGSEYAHFGGMIGSLVFYLFYKLKKGTS